MHSILDTTQWNSGAEGPRYIGAWEPLAPHDFEEKSLSWWKLCLFPFGEYSDLNLDIGKEKRGSDFGEPNLIIFDKYSMLP